MNIIDFTKEFLEREIGLKHLTSFSIEGHHFLFSIRKRKFVFNMETITFSTYETIETPLGKHNGYIQTDVTDILTEKMRFELEKVVGKKMVFS